MYICPSSAIDRALVSGMSISVNIFYFHSKPLPFMLQEATQPTAKQKKVGDPEQELKGCCNRGLSRSLAVSPKNQETLCIYIYIYSFNLLCTISSICTVTQQFPFILQRTAQQTAWPTAGSGPSQRRLKPCQTIEPRQAMAVVPTACPGFPRALDILDDLWWQWDEVSCMVFVIA